MLHIKLTKIKRTFLFLITVICIYFFGILDHLFEADFYNDFHYPYDGDVEMLVEQLKNDLTPDVPPINVYNFKYSTDCAHKCKNVEKLRLVYLIKSSPENFDRRLAIRSTWGYEKRFSDVEIRTIFLLGERNDKLLMKNVQKEHTKFQDIVKANFTDSYYNNTYKTMMGMEWIVKYCSGSQFYMFVDDDYYVSTKNLLRFTRNPTSYPDYLMDRLPNVRKLKQYELADNVILYAGYMFHSSPHRHITSKWYVSLDEYPYHMWPPYVTAGAYILSKSALTEMYYTSFYTQHFRFDDVYMGLLAYKAKITPLHCDNFHFYKKPYSKFNFKYTVATHGYGEPQELQKIWSEQKGLGNA